MRRRSEKRKCTSESGWTFIYLSKFEASARRVTLRGNKSRPLEAQHQSLFPDFGGPPSGIQTDFLEQPKTRRIFERERERAVSLGFSTAVKSYSNLVLLHLDGWKFVIYCCSSGRGCVGSPKLTKIELLGVVCNSLILVNLLIFIISHCSWRWDCKSEDTQLIELE